MPHVSRPAPDSHPPGGQPRGDLIELQVGLYRREDRCLLRSEGELRLTPMEGRLLEYLHDHAGVALSHAQLLEDVWEYAPGVESRSLYSTINRLRQKIEQDPANPQHVLAVASTGYRFCRLPALAPAPVDALVGRGPELGALQQALTEARLVTVLASGGMGKTRLVLAWMGQGHSPSTFCDLSAAIPSDLALRVARSLGVPPGSIDPVSQIGPLLRSRGPHVLVLDNAETVTRALAPLVRSWLAASPETRLLITTREPLKIAGERRFPLGPLGSTGLHSEGVELFCTRMSEVNHGAPVSHADRRVIAEIVAALEGVPLAIELAARRSPLLDLEEILERLDLRLLSAPGVEGRHRSMQSCIDGSWAVLTAWEQAAFSQLSVFVAPFGLESAEAVLELSTFPDAPWVVDVLQSLLERSLIQSQVIAGARLFRLQDTLRAYAALALAAHPTLQAEALARHGTRYARLGEQEGLDALRARGGLNRRALLSRERDDLVAACRRAISRGDATVAVCSSIAASLVFHTAGPAAEGVALLQEVGAMPAIPGALRARLRMQLGMLLRSSGRPIEARVEAEAALSLAREAGAREAGARVTEGHATLGVAMRMRDGGDSVGAERLCKEAIRVGQEAGDEIGESLALLSLANIFIAAGRFQDAREPLTRSLQRLEARADPLTLPAARISYANLLYLTGDIDGALPAFEAAQEAAATMGDVRNLAFSTVGVAEVLLEAKRPAQAEGAFQRAIELFQQNGDAWAAADAHAGRAEAFRVQGRLSEAEAEARIALGQTAGRGASREVDVRLGLCHILLDAARGAEVEQQLLSVTPLIGAAQLVQGAWCLATRGLLALRRGEVEAARACLLEARALLAPSASPLWGTPGRALRALEAGLDAATAR